jgi:SAM-dependent methyltransferase
LQATTVSLQIRCNGHARESAVDRKGERRRCRRPVARPARTHKDIIAMTTTDPTPTAVTNPNKALWEKGDFTRIAATMRTSGDALVDTLGVTADMQVLDLGCGDGTTAVPTAKRGATVLGVDIASNLVAAGNERAFALGLTNLTFQEGDASNLATLGDDSFDLVVTIFGAMFAPRPFDVAQEMTRVTKPGGRIVMGNWIPGDPTLVAQLLKISGSYSPPPPEGFISPVTWGVESNVVERFTAAGVPESQISCERAHYTFELAGPASELLAIFRDYYGPTMNAFAAATADGRRDDLERELVELFESQNSATTPGTTSITATFLKVTVTV